MKIPEKSKLRRAKLFATAAAASLLLGTAAQAETLTCGAGNDAKCLGMTMSYVADQANGTDMIISNQVTAPAIVTAAGKRMSCLLKKAADGPWALAWGPAVTFDNNKAINTAMVARKGTSSTYYIGVAGTDFDSIEDWVMEDFFIAPTTDGGFGDMTTGTYTGLNHVLTQPDAANTTLPAFLMSATTGITSSDPAPVFNVAGHSLGGALSPAIGIWLKANQATWDKSEGQRAQVNVHAFAGATPGGPKLKNMFAQRFPSDGSSTDGGNLVMVNNTKDVVPHGWSVDLLTFNEFNMYETLFLYGTPGSGAPAAGTAISAAIGAATTLAIYERREARKKPEFSDFNYLTLGNRTQQQSLSGRIYPNNTQAITEMAKVCPSFQANPPKTLDYAHEALFQHVCAYDVLLGMKGTLNNASHQCGQANLPAQN